MTNLLPDVLRPRLKVVFCGTAAGLVSARTATYYAHSNNKFWDVLAETGLTDRRVAPHEFRELPKFGIGLTDLCKDAAGSDRKIRPKPEHREELRRKIANIAPTYLAFTSLEAGKRYFGRKVQLGVQQTFIEGTSIYVLPSTSLMAAWNWNANKHHWQDFAKIIRSLP